jgi:hypothetical protein
MRILFQGSMTPAQLGKAVQDILENTLAKVEGVESKRYPLHNAVVEFNLNLKGYEEPQLLMDEDKGQMLNIRTGFHKGEFTEYIEVDKQELVDKFNRMVADGEQHEQLELELEEETKNPVN